MRTSPFGSLCSSSSYGPAFPRSPSRTLHVDIDNKKDTPFGVSFFVNQRLPIPARIAVATLLYACLEPDAMALRVTPFL